MKPRIRSDHHGSSYSDPHLIGTCDLPRGKLEIPKFKIIGFLSHADALANLAMDSKKHGGWCHEDEGRWERLRWGGDDEMLIVMTDAGIRVGDMEEDGEVELGVGLVILDSRWMQPVMMWSGYWNMGRRGREEGEYDINKWELLGSRLDLEATKRLRTNERKEILRWGSREGGEWGTESEDLGRRQVENLMELLPDALRWSREKQIGGWGI